MTTKRSLALFSIALFSLTIKAQDTDFGIWYEAQADCKIYKGFRFDFEASIRTDNDGSNVESFYFEPGLRYKINDYFNAGIYYRLIKQKEDNDRFHARHRWFIQLKGNLPVRRFTFSARYRIQQQFRTYIEDPEDETPQWYHRLRLETDYDIKGIPLKVYINSEMFSMIFSSNDIWFEKWRHIAGAEYTLNKKHTFGVEYIYSTSRVSKPARMNILGLTYSIKL